MKLNAKSLFAALLLSTATLAATAATLPAPLANPTAVTSSYKVAIFPSSVAPTKVTVVLEHQPGKRMEVRLRDAKGALLATQYISKKAEKVHFKFDLGELNDGEYEVEVVCGTDRTVHPVTLTTETPAKSVRLITMN